MLSRKEQHGQEDLNHESKDTTFQHENIRSIKGDALVCHWSKEELAKVKLTKLEFPMSDCARQDLEETR